MICRMRPVLLGPLSVLLAWALLGVAPAFGAEPEAPFWKVAGERLGAEKTKPASITNVSGKEAVLQSALGSSKAEIRCKRAVSSEGELEGSLSKHDGKAFAALELSECKLFIQESEKEGYKEQPGCEVVAIKSVKLAGKLWLEGAKASAGTRSVAVFEPKEPKEGKPLIAEVVIKTVTGKTCGFAGTYRLEGSFAARLLPENEEFTFIQLVLPSTAITTVWQPPEQSGEMTVGLALAGNAATLEGEAKLELESKERFGGGTAPVEGIEAPFWTTGGKRLSPGETRELKSEMVGKAVIMKSKAKGVEIKIECTKTVIKEASIIGSLIQYDGKVRFPIEFVECKLFTKEGEKFVEQPKCEVKPFIATSVGGRLWLEGAEAERGINPVLMLEPEPEGGNFATQTISNKGVEKCEYAKEYKIGGTLPLQLVNKSTVVKFVLPARPPEYLWQSAEQHLQRKTGLTFEGEPLTLEGELNNELPGKEAFSGGSTCITGQGASLQKMAQQNVWIPGSGLCVQYNSTSSGAAQQAWGAEEAGHKPKDGTKKNPVESGDTFIGTDEPLNESQLKNLDEAAGGVFGGTKGQALVIPVAQAAVAIIVNPPAGCTITKITNANLLAVLNGTKTEWKEIASGGTCTGKITRVVRKDVSGTTFVKKTYLEEIAKGAATCSGKTWKELAEPVHNLEWPENGQAGCAGLSEVVHTKNSGDGGEVEEVLAKEGSIGYASLGSARAKYNKETGNHYHWIAIENSTTGAEKVFEFPGTGGSEPQEASAEANCAETEYKNKPATVGPDDDWSKVNGAHPSGNRHYPICTLTYDIALVNYKVAGYNGEPNMEAGLATQEYLEYVVKPDGGQTALTKHDYREAEEAVGKYSQEEALLVAGVKISASTSELKFTVKGEKKAVEYTNNSRLESWLPFGPFISGTNGSSYVLVPGSNTCTGTIGIGGSKCKVEVEFVGTTHGKATLLLRQAPPIKLN